MKSSQRLDYAALSEVLGQRGLIDAQRLSMLLQTAHQQGMVPFCEMLVGDNLIGDWELSRVVCDMYGLPFLPVDMYTPSQEALKGLDRDFLRHYRLVPIGRWGALLVVAMPGMVPADVLGALEEHAKVQIQPVVGTVLSNNVWLSDNLSSEAHAASAGGEDWSNLFDVGDAAVLFDLTGEGDTPPDATAAA